MGLFFHEAYGNKAVLSGASNMFASLTTSGQLEEAAVGNNDKTFVCLLAHMAFVVTKMREHLRCRALDGSAQALTDSAGMNEGHREPWLRELITLDVVYWRLLAASKGLGLIDAASPSRAAAVPSPQLVLQLRLRAVRQLRRPLTVAVEWRPRLPVAVQWRLKVPKAPSSLPQLPRQCLARAAARLRP